MLDLQESTRRDDTYITLNKVIDEMQNINAFPALVWTWVWDVVKSKIDYYDVTCQEPWCIDPKLTEKDIFNLLWEDADQIGFSLEYGTEQLDESIFDWMLDRNILIEAEQDI